MLLMTSLMTTRMTRFKIRKDCLTMRNTEKYPNNAYNITIYLNKEDQERLNTIANMSGLSRGKVLAKLVHDTLPEAKMAQKTYVVHELTFE